MLACLRTLALLGALLAPGISFAGVDLPWMAQRARNDCGRAVLASLITWKKNGTLDDLRAEYDRVPAPRNSKLSLLTLMKVLIDNKLDVEIKSQSGIISFGQPRGKAKDHRLLLQDIRENFQSGQQSTVIVPVVRKGVDHYLVLVDAAQGQFIVHDPDPKIGGPKTRVTDEKLAGMMRSKFDGVVLVVSRDEIQP